MLFGNGLRLSDEPLESFLAALFLQLLPDHIPAGHVVVVEPVALQEGKKDRRGAHHGPNTIWEGSGVTKAWPWGTTVWTRY